jgi:hypothetical protein
LNHENPGFSSGVSIPPALPFCAATSAGAKSVRAETKKSASIGVNAILRQLFRDLVPDQRANC